MRNKDKGKRRGRYIPLAEIEKINSAFLDEMERVKTRLCNVKDEAIITAFHEVLLGAYSAAIELRTLECEVEYDIKFAEIKERRNNLKPWRRCWLWRLLFRPLTNRAQDIIEERAELDADIIHTAEEKEIDDERKKLPLTDRKKPSKRKLERKIRAELNEVIERADKADMNEAFAEPQGVAEQKPVQEQSDMNSLLQTRVSRPRPPRSCRKPPA